MSNSLSDLASSAENCGLEEWVDIFRSTKSDHIMKMNQKRDPLTDCTFSGIDITCVCGFRRHQESHALVYFWCADFGVVNYHTLPNRKTIHDLIKLSVMIGSVAGNRPNLPAFKGMFEGQLASLCTDGAEYLKEKHLYWAEYGDLVFAGLFSLSKLDQGFSAESILNCLDFHSDYFRVSSPVWNSVPMPFLFDRAEANAELVAKLLLEPKCFDPVSAEPQNWFLWPWQRSLGGTDGTSIRYQPIETTSLVFDLRKSTMALEQLRDEDVGLFSGFIKEVIRSAQSAVFSHGGFFDKDTGDGIVAHFTEFHLPGIQIEPVSLRAFKAAKELITAVYSICEKFQRKLTLGVGGLGASVGLHTGKAVWICENNRVSAIGESVIIAARLCAEASNVSIFVSNHEFQRLAKNLSSADISRFTKTDYLGKEYNDRSKLYGYSIRV